MALGRFQTLFLLGFVFLLSGGFLSVKARETNKKPGICRKHEEEEWCDEDQDDMYSSVHRTSERDEFDAPVKTDSEKITSTDTPVSSFAGVDHSKEILRDNSSPVGLPTDISAGEQENIKSGESHSHEDSQTETAGVGQPADRERRETSDDKEAEPELRVPFVSGVKVLGRVYPWTQFRRYQNTSTRKSNN